MRKYINRFKVFAPLDKNTGLVTANPDDTYLKAKVFKIEVYRQNEDQLAIYFPSGEDDTKKVLKEFKRVKIKYELYISGDFETVVLVAESDFDKIHKILRFQEKVVK